jgi:hypothetical protein
MTDFGSSMSARGAKRRAASFATLPPGMRLSSKLAKIAKKLINAAANGVRAL